MTTAQCIFVAWLVVGVVAGGTGALVDRPYWGNGFGGGLVAYIAITFPLFAMAAFFVFLGTL